MNKVREFRKERGLSQDALAQEVFISRKYLSMIERQLATPSISIAMRIGNALGVSVDKVFIDKTENISVNYPTPVRFIDLFCGIGGFRYAAKDAFDSLGLKGECVFSSDIDKYAQQSYKANFGEKPYGDIKKIDAADIPDFDILFGGFPCQAFSICGLQKGFEDNTRGTLFFDIARIIKEKQPQAFVLENVKNLASHDNGNTLKTILDVLRDELGYHVDHHLLNALDFGLPQKRERIIIIGSKNPFVMNWDFNVETKKTLNDILEKEVDKKHFASPEIVSKRKSMHTAKEYPSIWHENKSGNISSYPYSCALRAGASYNYLLVNGERRLTPREMLRLQGFPDSFKIVVSDCQTRKQAGNAIPVDMVSKVIERFMPLAF
ncbi:DNA (cytosine-5-)-methyltransferase [Ruminococcus sp.]|uniref:DNA (cytosine-5-)-methyltransferase n=1 Tax=Ruminococcus sp. TaxID=41978 RepID=UPI00386DD4A8